MKLLDGVKAKGAELRERFPLVDHVVRMQEHYSAAQGSQQAGAVTYFGFLSIFPILALAFFVVGWIARVYPNAQDTLLTAIDRVLPGLVGGGTGQVALSDVQDAAGAVGLIGLVGVLYAGLGWLSSLQSALMVLFEMPARLRPNFVVGKLRDLTTMAVLGLVLMLSVGLSAVLTRTSRAVLDLVGVDGELGWIVTILAVLLGLAASALLFFLIFRLLVRPTVPDRALWSGAVLGAIGFEVLKQLSGLLLTSTRGQPAFQAFGIALILLVWINYFTRVVLYAAAWAKSSPYAERAVAPISAAIAAAVSEPGPVEREARGAVGVAPVAGEDGSGAGHRPTVLAFVGGTLAGAFVATIGRARRAADRRPRTPARVVWETGGVKFERKHAILLLAVAAWNVFSFGNFAKNLYNAYDAGEDRATGYWVAHTVLIVVNFVIAGLLGSLGWKALRASKTSDD